MLNLLIFPCSGDTGCFFTDDTTNSIEILCNYSIGRDSKKSCFSWNYNGSSWEAHKAEVISLIVMNCTGDSPSMNVEFFKKFNNLKELDVSFFFELSILYSEALNMKQLKKLNASHNHFTELLESYFENLPSLAEADFSFNKIKTLESTTFAISKKLQILNLSNNLIETIDRNLIQSLQRIKHLNVSNNQINNIREIIESLGSSIETLDISLNPLGNLNADSLKKFTNLKYLNLRQTQLSKISSATPQYLPFYGNGRKLLELHIEQNPIERIDCNIFLLLFSSISSEISWENAKEIDTSCLADLLQVDSNNQENEIILRIPLDNSTLHCSKKYFQKLTYLNISGNHLKNTQEIIDLLGPAVQTLDASFNFIGKLNAKTLKRLSNLQFLNLSHTNLSNFGFNTFYSQNRLTKLDLSFNRLKKVDFTLFVRNFKGLNTLSLEGNDLTEIDSVTRFNFPRLTVLAISKNRFSCRYLAYFLHQWEDLQLFHNPSDQTHIDGVDCYHEDDNMNEGDDSERKDQENIQSQKTTSIDWIETTENGQSFEEAETTGIPDNASSAETLTTETIELLETTTTIDTRLHSEETPTTEINDISSGITEVATVDYRSNNVTKTITESSFTTNGHSSTDTVQGSTTKIEKINSSKDNEQGNGSLRSTDSPNSILAELRILRYILLSLLVICLMYFVVKTKLIQRIKKKIPNYPGEGGAIYRHDARSSQHSMELIKHADSTMNEYNN